MTSTDGIICFGFELGEDVELPWDHGDLNEWWFYKIHPFEPTFYPFTERGDYKPGITKDCPEIRHYLQERRAHKEASPRLPIQLVNVCSCDCPIWIAAVPGAVIEAARGYPVNVKANLFHAVKIPESKLYLAAEKTKAFLVKYADAGFQEKYPEWFLGSYWG